MGAPTVKNRASVMTLKQLWHHRFGHSSSEVMSTLFKNLEILGDKKENNKLDVCDVCFRAKQTRSRFSISENKASDLFDLIHCDVWGPYRFLWC